MLFISLLVICSLSQMGQMMPGMMPQMPGMMPPMMPVAFECETLKSPMMCNLEKTKGRCAWLARDQKCDLAEKCSGRDQASCALYWTGNRAGPNCVWLAMEEKCDSSKKCYGRDQATCTNEAFPRCTWTMPFTTSWGQVFTGGMCTEFKGLASAKQILPGMAAAMAASNQGELPETDAPGAFSGRLPGAGSLPGAGAFPMPPPMVQLEMECEILTNPMMCNLASTRGSCAWLAEDQKCDIADKCSGRDKQSCALYYKGNRMGPNCVWLELEGKCDSSKKCYGRDQATCTNPAFPRCTWTAPYITSWGQTLPGGMCEEYKGPSNPFAAMMGGGLQATHMEQPESTSSNHLPRNVMLISVGSFILSGLCTFLCLRKRQQQSSEHVPL